MDRYRKLIAAAIGVALMLVNQHFGVDLTGLEPQLVDVLTGLIGAGTLVAVERLPNATKGA